MPLITKRLLLVVFLILFLTFGGTIGYMVIEGWSFLESLYMTTISLTTVGFMEVHPLGPAGRVFTIILITLGVGLFFYAIGILAEAVVEGQIKGIVERRRMQKEINKLKDHYIVCGYGRLGRVICNELRFRNLPVVIIDNNDQAVKEAEDKGILYYMGDATLDESLLKVGISMAKGLITVLGTDAANVYITISARTLNKKMIIVARADDDNAERKLFQVGATKVISPYKIGAIRMALAVLKPTLTEFLDVASHTVGFDLDIEQVEIRPGSDLSGKALKEVNLRERTGATVIALKKKGREMSLQLNPNIPLESGDIIIVMGSKDAVNKVLEMAGYGSGIEDLIL